MDKQHLDALLAEIEQYLCNRKPREGERLLAAATRALRERDWQPIGTAPKDGTYVLLWEPGELNPVTCAYTEFGDDPPKGYYSGWYDSMTGHYEATTATHWMPLPSPPALASSPAERQE